MELSIFTDGGATGNPGPAASAFVVYQNDKIIHREAKKIGKTTNNVAEYKAVIMALEWLLIHTTHPRPTTHNPSLSKITFYSDSQLIVNQLNGLYKIKDAKLRVLTIEVKQLEQEIKNLKISYHLIPREQNKVADALIKSVLI